MFYIIVAILIFGILVATHELGHFATAKLLGVKVNEFSVGMGPAIWQSGKRSEEPWEEDKTVYSLRLLPIGGFFTMDAFQAAHAARLLKAKTVTPMHWGTFPVLAPTPDEFMVRLKEVAPRTRPVIMRPGETVHFA